ncbi:MAG: hypothetical protein ACOH1Y_17215 [Propionicimonas sp.]
MNLIQDLSPERVLFVFARQYGKPGQVTFVDAVHATVVELQDAQRDEGDVTYVGYMAPHIERVIVAGAGAYLNTPEGQAAYNNR